MSRQVLGQYSGMAHDWRARFCRAASVRQILAVLVPIFRHVDLLRLHKAAPDGKPPVIVEEDEGSRLCEYFGAVGFRSGIEGVDPLFGVGQLRLSLVVGHAAFDQLGKLIIFSLSGFKRGPCLASASNASYWSSGCIS